MICNVSKLNGISGMRKNGKVWVNSPISPTVRTPLPVITAIIVHHNNGN